MHTFSFNVQTLAIKDGKSLRSIKPDKDGVYRNVPTGILRKSSRNKAYYLEDSIISAITNPASRFYIAITEGNLEGEWGHPMMSYTKEGLIRMLTVERTRVSHYICGLHTRDTSDGKYTVMEADIVPFGPYAQYLIDSFNDSKRNTAFSLRALTKDVGIENAITKKQVLTLVTFDAVDAPGFEEASKRFMVDNTSMTQESLNIEFPVTSHDLIEDLEFKKAVGFESLNSDELFDIFGTDSIKLFNEETVMFCPDKRRLLTPAGAKSIFHTLYKREGKK